MWVFVCPPPMSTLGNCACWSSSFSREVRGGGAWLSRRKHSVVVLLLRLCVCARQVAVGGTDVGSALDWLVAHADELRREAAAAAAATSAAVPAPTVSGRWHAMPSSREG